MLYSSGENFTLYQGDNRVVLKELPDNSIDSIVTDPPYELGFMGKKWDTSGIAFNVEVWQEALRVLKPGGHLLAFSGSRTYHRMAVAIEDAGFEIRDQIMWIYGSGFPKSLDVSKAIDKVNGETDRLIRFTLWMRTTGLKVKDVSKVLVDNGLIGENGTIASHYFAMKSTSQPAIPTVAMWKVIRPLISEVPQWVDELVQRIEAEREVVGKGSSTLINASGTYAITNGEAGEEWKPKEYDITAPATAAAQQWQGWGTALKPAHEPVVLARKSLIGTVAENVLTYGTGGLNIDGGRVGSENGGTHCANRDSNGKCIGHDNGGRSTSGATVHAAESSGGRWPANVIHDGSDEVVELFPNSKGGAFPAVRGKSDIGAFALGGNHKDKPNQARVMGDDGSAARFFYCAKASKKDRNEGVGASNNHPTVKPTTLMEYLCKLVTPPSGTVLDPFMGSGSTGKAALYAGFKFIGIEMTDEYLPIAKARIEFAEGEVNANLPIHL